MIKVASFVYDLLSAHPFKVGNGRLCRLISTLLLLKNGYKWIQYVSFEHEIENRKNEYYQVLRSCQAQRPNEDVTIWIQFFLNCLSNIQSQLLTKLQKSGMETQLSPKEKSIYTIIQNRPNIQSGDLQGAHFDQLSGLPSRFIPVHRDHCTPRQAQSKPSGTRIGRFV